MPAYDLIHNAVKNALIKDGWVITAEPFTLSYKGVNVFADLAAERAIAAERAGNKIVVEIKSFVGASQIRELETALGQYSIYRDFLELLDPARKIFIGVSDSIYNDFFSREGIQFIVRKHELTFVIVNIEREEIVKWINTTDTAI